MTDTTPETHEPGLENLLTEDRRFPPSAEFTAQANAQQGLYAWANADRPSFWAEQARELLSWEKPFEEVLDWSKAPFARWFADGTLNAAYNAVDRHVEAGNGDRVALHFEGEGGDTRTVTYADLQREVSKAANAFTALGVGTGDRVAIYLPLIPEAVVTMLACARIGAPHSVVFGGFSAEALSSRINDAEAEARRHRGRRVPPRGGQRPEAGRRRGADQGNAVRGARARRQAHGPGRRLERRGRRLVVRRRRHRQRPAHPGRGGGRAPAVHPLHVGHHGEAEGHLPHHRRLPDAGRVHAPQRVRPQARDGRLLVHGRRRLDHGAHLRRLRAADQRRHAGHLRGHARQPAPRSLVGDHPEVQGLDLLHGTHGHPHLHEVGRGDPRPVRPVEPAGARVGG